MSISFSRIAAVFIKELVQMKRDRLTFGMMFGIPLIQLVLFGFAINTDPKNLPTALILEEQTPIVRTLVASLESSGYFDIRLQEPDPRASQKLLARGDVAFVITFPLGFTKNLVRQNNAQVLVEADASDPAASSGAVGRLNRIFEQALQQHTKGALSHIQEPPPAIEVITHAKYNPEGITQYNIVPGLLGVILTMTLVMITSMAMTKEIERGTMENLLAMPARPLEVMLGKITPYILVGSVQTLVILLCAHALFDVPFIGNIFLLLVGVIVFMFANLSLGFTFSTLVKTQMQAMQLTFFFFLPSLLLSGFMFPFRGMPEWAQVIGEALPLTHFLRIIRGVMLKGAGFAEVQHALLMMLIFSALISFIAMRRYRQTLD